MSGMTMDQRVRLLHEHQLADDLVRGQFVFVWKEVMKDENFLQRCAREFERKDAAERILHAYATRHSTELEVAASPPALSYRF